MEITVKSGNPEKQRTACIVIGVFDSRKLSEAAAEVDAATDGYISNIVRRGDMEGEKGQYLMMHNVPGVLAERVLLIGCGRERDLNDRAFRSLCASSAEILNKSGALEAVSYITDLQVKNRSVEWKCYTAAVETDLALYQFSSHKSKVDSPRKPLKKIVFNVPSRRELAAGEEAVLKARAVAAGTSLARNLGNLAPNVCNPGYLARQAQQLKKQYRKLKIEILDEAEMKRLGMGALLSVSRGSKQPGKLICMEYSGGKRDEEPVVLVGKGVTFDSGGISLKPGAQMDEMKYDMCGAASVFGVIRACADMQLSCNVIGLIPAVENMPDADASRPGDVVTSMSGQTIEILNTDAEGRLILCDALTYADKYNPDVVIDVATLTGACIIALGHSTAGLMGNHKPLINDLISAGKNAGDACWELPLDDDYQKLLDSNFADMANIGGRAAGTITAGCFLSRYTKKYRWAHLDIAGVAWKSGKEKGATGRPVPMLMEYLFSRCGQNYEA